MGLIRRQWNTMVAANCCPWRCSAVLLSVAAAFTVLYVMNTERMGTRIITMAGLFETSGPDANKRRESSVSRKPPPQLPNSSVEMVHDCCKTKTTGPLVSKSKSLDLGWPGFSSTCQDTVPSYDELLGSSVRPDHVELTYVTCCSNGSDILPISCRNASKPLVIPRHNAKALLEVGSHTIDLSTINVERDFIFMTGVSSNHYRESITLISMLQKHFLKRTIVYWDLGLTTAQADEVKKFCDVLYKRFNFSKYPEHVQKLSTYAFKPLCIMETLTEYPLVWWVDTSIRFTGDDPKDGLSMVGLRHGLVLFDDPGHSVWSTTYRQTYEYLATDEIGLQRTISCMGGSIIVANTPEIFSTFLYWFSVCALDVRCMAPIDYPEGCKFAGPNVFAKCHRFDQSVMTMLAANFWGFANDNYRFQHKYFIVLRREDGQDNVHRCPAK